MPDIIRTQVPWLYYNLWLLDYMWIPPAGLTVVSCFTGLAYSSVSKHGDSDVMSLLEVISILSCIATIGLSLCRVIASIFAPAY